MTASCQRRPLLPSFFSLTTRAIGYIGATVIAVRD